MDPGLMDQLEAGYNASKGTAFQAAPQTQQRQAPGGVKGFLSGLLPVLGGGAGALIGSLAGPAGTIAGGAAGSALGEAGREKIAGGPLSAKDIGIQGAFGAIPGVFSGIKALRGISAGAKAIEGAGGAAAATVPRTAEDTIGQKLLNSAAFKGQQMKANVSGMGVGAKVSGSNPLMPFDSTALTDFLAKEKVPHAAPDTQLANMQPKMTAIANELQGKIAANDTVLTQADRNALADHYLATVKSDFTLPKEALDQANYLADQIRGADNLNSVSQLLEGKRNFDAHQLSYTRNPGSAVPGSEQATRIARNVFKDEINNHVPDAAALNEKYHNYSEAADYLLKQAGRTEGSSIAHPIAALATSGPVQTAKAIAGNAIQKGAEALGGQLPGAAAPEAAAAAPSFLRQLAGATGKQALATGVGNALVGPSGQPQQQAATPTDVSQVPGAQDLTTPGPAPSAYSVDQLMHDINANPKQAATAIALYKALNPASGNTAADKANQTKSDALNMASASLDAAEQNLVASGGAKGAGGEAATIPFLGKFINPQGAAYHNTRIELATQMAKAITGGSRPGQQVVEYYLKSLPDVTDTPEYAAAKIAKMRNELQAQADRFGLTIGSPIGGGGTPDITSALQAAGVQ